MFRNLTTVWEVTFEGHVTLREAIAVYCPMILDPDFYLQDTFISRNSHANRLIDPVGFVRPSATFRGSSAIFLLRRHSPGLAQECLY